MSLGGKYNGILYLTAVAVLLPLLAWRLALGGTVQAWRDTRRLQTELTGLRRQAVRLTSPGEAYAEEHIRDGGVLDDILAGPGHCEVVKYTPYVTAQTDGITVHTAQIVLKTDYLSAVRIADHIERRMPACRLRSVSMRSVTPRGSRELQMHATLIIQQITQNQ